MPVNQTSLGRDITFSGNDANGEIPLGVITQINIKQDQVTKFVRPVNGPPKPLVIPGGFSGTFEIARTGPEVEDYFLARNAAYYAGENENPGTITGIITEPDGSVTTRKLLGVLPYISDLGTWKADDNVTLTVNFMASELR